MVVIGRGREAKEPLQQHMDRGRREKVRAAGDCGHTLGRVVDRDRDVVGGSDVTAGEDDVADGVGQGV